MYLHACRETRDLSVSHVLQKFISDSALFSCTLIRMPCIITPNRYTDTTVSWGQVSPSFSRFVGGS